MPDVDVKKADRITVIQSTGQKHILFAKKPFNYPSHIEVTLTGSAIDSKSDFRMTSNADKVIAKLKKIDTNCSKKKVLRWSMIR